VQLETQNAWSLVKVDWSECEVMFDCLCGAKELYISDEPVTCDQCGRVYRLSARFTVEEPPDEIKYGSARGAANPASST
jgi:hypothetical protein